MIRLKKLLAVELLTLIYVSSMVQVFVPFVEQTECALSHLKHGQSNMKN